MGALFLFLNSRIFIVYTNERDMVITSDTCYNSIRSGHFNLIRKVQDMSLNFAENFKVLRKEKGMTQEKIAEALGVTSQSISRWELNICYPDLELLPSIANYFGVTVDRLLSNDADAKKKDHQHYYETIGTLSNTTTEQIDFTMEYCRKYPEEDCYAYMLMNVIRDHWVNCRDADAETYMPILLKNAERLLDTWYRTGVIRIMAEVCDENDLEKWLNMTPYEGFSRRHCLIARAIYRDKDAGEGYIQQGLEMLETFSRQLDRRFPDAMGAEKKAAFQEDVLRVIRSLGKDGEIPDGWKLFYAYKQLVLSACLFRCGKADAGWENFDAAIALCKHAISLQEEWLEIGNTLFSGLRVSRDWCFAIDENGNQHELFGIGYLSFYDMDLISDLLHNPRWNWFSSVRETKKFKAAQAWVEKIRKRREE